MTTADRPGTAPESPAGGLPALCLALTAIVVVLSALFQAPHTAEGGLGWDGAQYTALASQCWREPMRALEPFVYRIGAPCMAALLPVAPATGLRIVNTASAVVLLYLMGVWLRRHVSLLVARWLLVVFAFHWLTPLRQVWWYPTQIDPAAMAAMVGALLLQRRPWAFGLVCLAGALVRETTVVVPAAIAVAGVARRGTQRAKLRAGLAGTLASLAGIALAHVLVVPTSDYWMLDAAFHWAYAKPLPTYVLAWFVAYGPMIVLPLVRWPAVRALLADRSEYAVMLAAIAALAWVGGTDTERFLLWGAPVVLAMVGAAADGMDWTRARGPLILLAVAQVLNGRWILPTPDAWAHAPRAWPVLTPLAARHVEYLLSLTPDRPMAAVSLAQYLALSAVLVFWLKRRAT